MELRILPMQKDAPIYIPSRSAIDFEGQQAVEKVQNVTVTENYDK